MRPLHSVIKALLLVAGLGLGWSSPALAAQVGTVSHLSGLLFAQKTDGTAKALNIGSAIDEGDTLVTQEGAFARIKLKDEGEMVLRPNSQLQIRQYIYDQTRPQADSAVMHLLKGSLRTVTGWIGKRSQRDAYRMETPTATIGIRGTDYDARYCQDAASCGPAPNTGGQQTPASLPQESPDTSGAPVPVAGTGPTPVPPPTPPATAGSLHVQTNSGSISVGNEQGEIIVGPGQHGFVPGPSSLPVITLPTLPPAQIFPSPPPSVGIPGSAPLSSGGSLGPSQSCQMR